MAEKKIEMGNQASLKKYQAFYFEGVKYAFDFDASILEVLLNYSLDEKEKFTEKLGFSMTAAEWEAVDMGLLDKALEGLLLVGGISYYKAYCPARMELGSINLNKEQAAFWTKLYERGLGEFFYKNDLDWRGLINFPIPKVEEEQTKAGEKKAAKGKIFRERCLLPLGGGKDSIVSGELLRLGGEKFLTFSLRDAEPIRQTAEIMGKSRVIISRELAPRLMEMNAEGALNGHVPITAYISFLLAVAAVLYDYKYLILSLEKSANFGQVIFHGMDVNHQYSKSEEFEGDFRDYLKNYICPDIEYFSLLRGFYEIRIAQIFAGLNNFDRYAPLFTSCNANFKMNKDKPTSKWCGHCPKCLFVFIILAAFVERDDLLKIFGANLLDKAELKNLLEETLGMRDNKPFECVGTFEESQLAMYKISQKKEWKSDILVGYFATKMLPKLGVDWSAREEELLSMQKGHFIPEKFLKIIDYAI